MFCLLRPYFFLEKVRAVSNQRKIRFCCFSNKKLPIFNSFFSGMFVVAIQHFVTFVTVFFKENFCFLDWLYFCFTCIQFSRCIADTLYRLSGDKEIRTPDPLLARQVLSQLSYTPKFTQKMGSSGLEPPTSRLSGVRSNRLSYEPIGLRQPSTLPGSCPPSTIDRSGLNRRVRNGNGCVPWAHHHRRYFVCFLFSLKVWSFKTEQWIFTPTNTP